jgi:hypothetical protein
MPAYVWICLICATSNKAGVDVCTRCTAPAELTSIEIARRRRGLGLDSSPEPESGLIRRQIAKCRIWLPGIYVAITGVAGLHIVFCSGDMCAMLLGLALLPWTMVPVWIPFQIRDALPAVDYLLVTLGFAVNVALLHLIGRRIDALAGKTS